MDERDVRSDLADSLETLLQLVATGFGCTLLPALALSTLSAKDNGIMARKLQLPDTCGQVSLVFRRTFPRRRALEAFAGVVRENLPDTVHPV